MERGVATLLSQFDAGVYWMPAFAGMTPWLLRRRVAD
jgi:hypothetical protein